MEDAQEALVFHCKFVEDAEGDTENIMFLWKTLIKLKEYILSYLLSSDQRLPQKLNGFSVFFSVFHKNTYKISIFFIVFRKSICKAFVFVTIKHQKKIQMKMQALILVGHGCPKKV